MTAQKLGMSQKPAPLPRPKDDRANTELNAINTIVGLQRMKGDPIDPNGARRLVQALEALGLLKFE